jgi:hypothetical protein
MSRKKILSLFVPLLFSIATKAQQSIIGKKFETEYANQCAKMQGGGCTTITNCILDFQKETVIVSFPFTEDCSINGKKTIKEGNQHTSTYQWSKRGNKIRIKGFENFEEIIIKDNKVFAWKSGNMYEFLPKNNTFAFEIFTKNKFLK